MAMISIRQLVQGIGILLCVAGCSKAQPIQVTGGDPARGKVAIEHYGCVACHTIQGIPNPGSNVGPPLERLAERVYIAGVLANTPENMVRWLRNPPEVDPRTVMPNMGISDSEAKDIAAYLYTLN
jgi:cytochrome c